jgi:excinuclease UvrABC ATPase subunit
MLKPQKVVSKTAQDTDIEDLNTFRLDSINLTIPGGKMTVITGAQGSGKSSLLYSIFGEMNAHRKESDTYEFPNLRPENGLQSET